MNVYELEIGNHIIWNVSGGQKREGAKRLGKSRTRYLIWIPVGIVVCFVEMILLSVSSIHEIFKETVVLSVVPTVLFWAVNRYGKGNPFYFFKRVVCIWIGRIVIDVILYLHDGSESLHFFVSWQVMLTMLLFCMRIIQMVYDRVPDKEMYFGYILIGAALAFNVSYIVREYRMVSADARRLLTVVGDMYVLEHGIVFLIVVAVTVYWHQKRVKDKLKNSGITKKAYLFHAIKMTAVSFLLLVYPLYTLFLGE